MAPAPEQPSAQAIPIVTPEQYRFLRYALELTDRFTGGAEGLDAQATGADAGDPRPGSTSRLRSALWLFEEFPPSPEDDRRR